MHFPGLIRAALAAALLTAPLPALAQAPTFGSVTLKADPANGNQATRKSYVDAAIAAAAVNMANAANLSSGVLSVSRLPTGAGGVALLDGTGKLPAALLPAGSGGTLAAATATTLGGVKAGSGLLIGGDGTLSVDSVAPTALSGSPQATDGILMVRGGVSYLVPFSAFGSGSGTTLAVPGQVTSLAIGTPGATVLPVTWTAPSTGGAASAYTVQHRVTGGTAYAVDSSTLTALSYTITGLTAGTSYDVQVIAANSTGAGTPSAVVAGSTAAAPAVATAFNVALGSASGAAGTAVPVTVTPVSGVWPAGETLTFSASSGLSGTFNPATASPAAGTSTASVAQFTPTAAGSGTISVSASPSMTAPAGVAFTATAAQTAPSYTFALTQTGSIGNGGYDVQFSVVNASGVTITPSNLPLSGWIVSVGWSKSSTVAPQPGSLNYQQATWNTYQAGYWEAQRQNYPFGSATGTYYPWIITSDGAAYCLTGSVFTFQ